MTIYQRYNKQRNKTNKIPYKTIVADQIDNYIDAIVTRRTELEELNVTENLLNNIQENVVKELQKAISI